MVDIHPLIHGTENTIQNWPQRAGYQWTPGSHGVNIRNFRQPSDPDDTLAFQRAFDQIAFTRGAVIVIPPDDYYLSDRITIPLHTYLSPVRVIAYGAIIHSSFVGATFYLTSNCSGLLPSGDAFQYPERSVHFEGGIVIATAGSSIFHLNGSTACTFKRMVLVGNSTTVDGAGVITLSADYYHWTEQCAFVDLDIKGGIGILFDMNVIGVPAGGSNMNNTFENLHIWVNGAAGRGVRARQVNQWMGRNQWSNIVVHIFNVANVVAYDLGDSFQRGASWISCAVDVYGLPAGAIGWIYNGIDDLVIISPEFDPPAYGWTETIEFTGTTQYYNIFGHRHHFRVDQNANAIVYNGAPGKSASLGVWGNDDGINAAVFEINQHDATRKWQFAHRSISDPNAHHLVLSYWNGAVWTAYLDISPAGVVTLFFPPSLPGLNSSGDIIVYDPGNQTNRYQILQATSDNYILARLAATIAVDKILQSFVSAAGVREANPYFALRADGQLEWGPGGATAADTLLKRVAAKLLGLIDPADPTNRFVLFDAGQVRLQFSHLIGQIATQNIIESWVSAAGAFEANARFTLRTDGLAAWGPGIATPLDSFLYRSGPNQLAGFRENLLTSIGNANIPILSTRFQTIVGMSGLGTAENTREMLAPRPFSTIGISAQLLSPQGGGGSLQIIVRKNGADTACLLTIPAGSAPGLYTANAVAAFTTDDLMCLKIVNNDGGGISGALGGITVKTVTS